MAAQLREHGRAVLLFPVGVICAGWDGVGWDGVGWDRGRHVESHRLHWLGTFHFGWVNESFLLASTDSSPF